MVPQLDEFGQESATPGAAPSLPHGVFWPVGPQVLSGLPFAHREIPVQRSCMGKSWLQLARERESCGVSLRGCSGTCVVPLPQAVTARVLRRSPWAAWLPPWEQLAGQCFSLPLPPGLDDGSF